MHKLFTALFVLFSLVASQPLFAAARVAVAHFAPFAQTLEGTAADIAVNGEVALSDVQFKDFTPYIDFEEGTYTIDVLVAGTDTVAISGEFMLMDGNDYTLYAVGNGITQDLELWALLDNTPAPDSGNLNLRIVHAAPFAADLDDTQVSIRTDGGDLVAGLTGVPYGVDSGFFQVPAGNYNLKVSSNDGSVNYIDILPVDLPEGLDITVFAVGDGINQELAIVALPVSELPTGMPVDNRTNGMWTIGEASGFGMTLNPMPAQNRLVGMWYQPDEIGYPTYFHFDSGPAGFDGMMSTTNLYQCVGGSLDSSELVDCTIVGALDWNFIDCDDLMVNVRLGDDDVGTEYHGRNLTQAFECTDAETDSN